MQQCSSCEADSLLVGQNRLCLLWNPKLYYRVHRILTQASKMSHTSKVHTFISHNNWVTHRKHRKEWRICSNTSKISYCRDFEKQVSIYTGQ